MFDEEKEFYSFVCNSEEMDVEKNIIFSNENEVLSSELNFVSANECHC